MTTSKPTDTPRRRLEDETLLCSETMKLNFGEHWETVCLGLQRMWSELAPKICQGKNCEDAVEINDLWRKQQPLPTSQWKKVECEKMTLRSKCLNGTKECLSITLLKCSDQDFKPTVTSKKSTLARKETTASSKETILGVLLGLVLTAVLLVICVPISYKKLKKFSKKRQHQWVGPSGVNQNASFHRISVVALQPHPEDQGIQQEDNYHALKKNSYLSPYAALEGATNRSSSPLDNSSDSDYDLSSARQL
ncbi:T-cell surface glycoprotein CD5 isoform X2 [Hemicordylus capensis]|nr:T-cell surface glycoprotein CD5 isoform X2 [Hemicordylus capensis]XP_053139213.1 T-cell surface glycoprotein CD5 isoform X2 [Hemicordylus capensis]XP_053139214.1 T-cell surface glycoprotein CD5 isoform X2 [Hemicordylus capensis]XP_053139215.1 T-cell surface glycoprotein CD5 isoform X2 [Hemicordylus capensis]